MYGRARETDLCRKQEVRMTFEQLKSDIVIHEVFLIILKAFV